MQGSPLSEHAHQLLLRTGMRRDPEKTCSSDELRRRLQELDLPVYEAAIDFERSFGGMVWKRNLWGTFASLIGRTTDTMYRLEEYHKEPVLPVGQYHHGGIQHWLSREGWILLDSQIGMIPVAESATCFFEREALRERVDESPTAILNWRAIPTGTTEDLTRFRDSDDEPDDDADEDFEPEYLSDPERPFDEQFAKDLRMPLHAPASDRCMHIWYDGGNLLFPYESWQSSNRLIRGSTMDDMVRMVAAAVRVCPTVAIIWEAPSGDPPRPGEEIAVELASIDRRNDWKGHLLFIGTCGHYRVYERLFQNRLSLARLWEARREEWEATQGGA